MNTKLQKLFDEYDLSEKDRYDFLQIYNLLPGDKKIRAVERFRETMLHIDELREDLYIEHEILFGSTLDRIEKRLERIKREKMKQQTQGDILSLKNTL